jgi:cytidine deaminase
MKLPVQPVEHGMDRTTEKQLIETAIEARQRAYAPYSNFRVGAALLTNSGKIFAGCNVENASYGLCVCAERTAICKAVSEGESQFVAIAVSASPLASPCGACRQFLFEFGADIEVISVDPDDLNQIKRWRTGSLLPDGFRFDS